MNDEPTPLCPPTRPSRRRVLLIAGAVILDLALVYWAIGVVGQVNVPGAATQPEAPKLSAKARSVHSLMMDLKKTRGYLQSPRKVAQSKMKDAGLERHWVTEGAVELLENGLPVDKESAARLLGYLGDQEAIPALLRALRTPQTDVRKRSCYALQWLNAKGESVEAELIYLCRNDSSLEVRVAAALVLGSRAENDAEATFRAGLNSEQRQVWETCEDGLTRLGKLKYPLPEHIYTEITPSQHRELMAKRYQRIFAETEKNGYIYFSTYFLQHDLGPRAREWFKVKAVKVKK